MDIAYLGPEVDAARPLLRETRRVAAHFITDRLAELSTSEILRVLHDTIGGPFKARAEIVKTFETLALARCVLQINGGNSSNRL